MVKMHISIKYVIFVSTTENKWPAFCIQLKLTKTHKNLMDLKPLFSNKLLESTVLMCLKMTRVVDWHMIFRGIFGFCKA